MSSSQTGPAAEARMGGSAPRTGGSASRADGQASHADGPAPLAGVRVVSIALNLPGPVSAARLQELGADVVTVLPPSGDPVATLVPALFEELHRGQQTRMVDMKSSAGAAEMEDILAEADVFITSHRSGALRRLGLDAEAVRARHRRICQVDITGFAGERTDVPGHDINYQAEAGLLEPGRPPRVLAADLHGAERAVSAALALLCSRGTHGDGGHAVVALAEAAHALALPNRHRMTDPASPLGGAAPNYGIYPVAAGHVAVGALEPHFAAALVEGLELDPHGDLREQLAQALLQHDARHWQAWGEERGIPLTALAAPAA